MIPPAMTPPSTLLRPEPPREAPLELAFTERSTGGVATEGGVVTAETARAPPATLTAASMFVAAVASEVAAEMVDWTADDDWVGAVIVTSITTLPAVTVTATSAAVTPLPAALATADLMSSSTVGV